MTGSVASTVFTCLSIAIAFTVLSIVPLLAIVSAIATAVGKVESIAKLR